MPSLISTPTTSTPTIAYDTEHPPTSPLDPPNMEAILRTKRHPSLIDRIQPTFPRGLQTGLTCLCIALSALQANGVYVWPTYGPVVARMLELDNAQAQTIVVGGILGVYLMAAPLGALTDRYGPRVSSLLSACLSLVGYMSFAVILKTQPPGTPFVHVYLTVAFAFVGAATVGSYFASLTTASLSFPTHPTLSLSLPLSLIGLSSLILSSFSTIPYFSNPSTPTTPPELNPIKFIVFLGILSPSINIFSACFMRILPLLPASEDSKVETTAATSHNHNRTGNHLADEEEGLVVPSSPIGQLLHLDEHTPLLIGGPEAAREEVELKEAGEGEVWNLARLVKDKGFWCFGVVLALSIGPAETIIASIGSILTFLLPPDSNLGLGTIASTYLLSYPSLKLSTQNLNPEINPLVLRNKHVFILSLSSTLARLLTGITADYLAPPLVAITESSNSHPHRSYTHNIDGLPADEESHAPYHHEHHLHHKFVRMRKTRLERGSFAALCTAGLGFVFAWSAGWLEGEDGLWVLSGGVGLMYGAIFTLTPAIISSHFGATNFGLAWGMVSYFPALGSVIFSYIYALLSVVATEAQSVSAPGLGLSSIMTMTGQDGIGNKAVEGYPSSQCYGTECFRETFWIAAGCCALSAIGMWVLGRRWRV